MANVALHESNKASGEAYTRNERSDKGMRSKFRDYNLRANKDIPENELDLELMDIENKRRHSLVLWHQNVMELHQELWQMSEELQDSLVREEGDDRAEQIKRSLQNKKPIDEMSEEELNRLPILMRPRPKYPPDKYMFMTKKQLRDINDKNYGQTMDRIRLERGGEDIPRLVRSETNLNAGHLSHRGEQEYSPRRTPRFPSLRTPQYYNILLRPERQGRIELHSALERARTMPVLETKSDESKGAIENGENGVSMEENEAEVKVKSSSSRRSLRKSVTPRQEKDPTPCISESANGEERFSPSKGLGMKSQSVPDLRLVKDDKELQELSGSMENLLKPAINSAEYGSKLSAKESYSHLNDIKEEKDSDFKKTPRKSKQKEKYLKSDKLDDLTDKQFRRKLITYYAKSRDDRNAANSMESSIGEKKTFLKIKMADIVSTSQKRNSQNRILKRLQERALAKEDEEEVDNEAKGDTKDGMLPVILTASNLNGKIPSPTKGRSRRSSSVALPSLRNDLHGKSASSHASNKSPAKSAAAALPAAVKTIGPFNQNNNNTSDNASDTLSEASLLTLSSCSSLNGTYDLTVVEANCVESLPAIAESESECIGPTDAGEKMARFLLTLKSKDLATNHSDHISDDQSKPTCTGDTMTSHPQRNWDIDIILENQTAVGDIMADSNNDHGRIETNFEDGVKDCKYLRGYDPLQSRPIENVDGFLFNYDEQVKLKNVTFFHPGQQNSPIAEEPKDV